MLQRETQLLPPWFRGLQIFLLVVVLPTVLMSIVYLGFVSNFLRADLLLQPKKWVVVFAQHGIMSSRYLGVNLLGVAHELMQFLQKHSLIELPAVRLDKSASQSQLAFYYSFFVLNTFFLVLTNAVAWLLLASKKFQHLGWYSRFSVLTLISFLVAVTQYVPMHYDCVFSFFLMLALYVLWNTENWWLYLFLLVAATLTRETAAIFLSLYATDYVIRYGFQKNRRLYKLAALVLCYVVVYLAAKFFSAPVWGAEVFDVVIAKNFLDFFGSVMGLLFFVVFFLSFCQSKPALKKAAIFALFCAPYLISLPFVARLWETRIWLPVLLPLIFITRLD